MTTLIINSDSPEKTDRLLQLANEMGLSAVSRGNYILDPQAIVHGIGRKASDEELTAYLMTNLDEQPLAIEDAFSKYKNKNC